MIVRQIPEAGKATSSLAEKARDWWLEGARAARFDLTGFDPEASLEERLKWCSQMSMDVALAYLRYSTKTQHSDEDQLRSICFFAGQNGLYLPPEFVCADIGVSGRRNRRNGLKRVKAILNTDAATCLLIFSLSRLFRKSYESAKFIQEEIVESGRRAVAVIQGIDTADDNAWKLRSQVYGVLDELSLEVIAQHVREGQRGLFLKRWVTGPIGVGYRRKIVDNAPLTNREHPRAVPEIDPVAAELIRKHAQWHIDGMSLGEGRRRWLAADGPCDPRSTTGHMTDHAYRRLWANMRLIGIWSFGRKRNLYSSKLDYTKQVEQPDKEVTTVVCEELRILDDRTFWKLQEWLNSLKTGPHGPRKPREAQLWDLTTEFFSCSHCSESGDRVRFHQTGNQGKGMRCKNKDQCLCNSAVRRRDAVLAICDQLADLLAADSALVEDVLSTTMEQAEMGDEEILAEINTMNSRIHSIDRSLEDFYELVGKGSESHRTELKSRIVKLQTERSNLEVELSRQNNIVDKSTRTLTRDDVEKVLANMSSLLRDAAAGELGSESVYRALAVFRDLTGGDIRVHVERRAGRKQSNVRGTFTPQLARAVKEHAGLLSTGESDSEEVSVWLRKPPRVDLLAERVHQLIDIEGLSHRDAAKRLLEEGENVNSGNVWYSYQRHYEMKGESPPKLPYNNGKQRESR